MRPNRPWARRPRRVARVGTGRSGGARRCLLPHGLHAYNIDSTGGSADLIQIGQQVCGAISPNVSPSVLTQDIYGRNVYTGRIPFDPTGFIDEDDEF